MRADTLSGGEWLGILVVALGLMSFVRPGVSTVALAWAGLTAVQNGDVIEMDDDIASRWGPRVVEYLASVAAAVQQVGYRCWWSYGHRYCKRTYYRPYYRRYYRYNY